MGFVGVLVLRPGTGDHRMESRGVGEDVTDQSSHDGIVVGEEGDAAAKNADVIRWRKAASRLRQSGRKWLFYSTARIMPRLGIEGRKAGGCEMAAVRCSRRRDKRL